MDDSSKQFDYSDVELRVMGQICETSSEIKLHTMKERRSVSSASFDLHLDIENIVHRFNDKFIFYTGHVTASQRIADDLHK